MLLEDRRRRVARLLRGVRRPDDLNHIFADLRLQRPGRASVREVGHFAAHRGERDKGIVLERAGAMQTSARLWLKQSREMPSLAEIREAGEANLAIMPDARVREKLGITRQAARRLLDRAMSRWEKGIAPNLKEREAINVLGFSMMWQFAFDDETLVRDLGDLLVAEGSMQADRRQDLDRERSFIVLHALSLMHGATLKMPDGSQAPLRLAAQDAAGTLRIKAEIAVPSDDFPVMTSVTLFETSLSAAEHCDPALLLSSGMRTPLEVENNRLVVIE